MPAGAVYGSYGAASLLQWLAKTYTYPTESRFALIRTWSAANRRYSSIFAAGARHYQGFGICHLA